MIQYIRLPVSSVRDTRHIKIDRNRRTFTGNIGQWLTQKAPYSMTSRALVSAG